MRPVKSIERLIKRLRYDDAAEAQDRILGNVMKSLDESEKFKRGPTGPQKRKIPMKNRLTRYAAAAVLIVGVSIVISYISKDQQSGSIAFADVMEAMQQARTITWTETTEITPPDDPAIFQDQVGSVAKCAYKAVGYERRDTIANLRRHDTNDITEHRYVNIIDRNAGRVLDLDQDKMTASIVSFDPAAVGGPLVNTFMDPGTTIPDDAELLGTKRIDNEDAVGFRLRKKDDDTDFWSGDITDIWVSAKTRRLVYAKTGDRDGNWAFILTDFVFDRQLDDSLFSLEPPDGYTNVEPPEIFQIEMPES